MIEIRTKLIRTEWIGAQASLPATPRSDVNRWRIDKARATNMNGTPRTIAQHD